jgi:hypothetical protein
VHRELVRSPEHTDSDFLETYRSAECTSSQFRTTYTAIRDEQLGEGAMVSSALAAHSLDGVDRGAGDAGDAAERRLGIVE